MVMGTRAFRNILVLCVLISAATGASQIAVEDALDVSALSGDKSCAGDDEGMSCHLGLLQGKAEALRRMQAMNITNPVEGTCKVEGNPDTITGFDEAHTSWLDFFLSTFHVISDEGEPVSQNGDMWLVKSPSVQIQGRYTGNQKGCTLRGIAVSGPFISNNVITIGTLNQNIFFNDEEILSEPESNFQVQKIADASRSNIMNTTKGQRDEINLDLGSDLKLIVKRGMNDLDIQITMLQADEGQDGQCGNFNGDPNDDTAELITERLMVEIPKDMVLFTHSFGDKESQPTKDLKPDKDMRIGEVQPHAQLDAKGVDDIYPYDCVNYPMPGQVLRFGNPQNPFKLYLLNPLNGTYQEVYTIPYDRTSPPFEDLNSCAISPVSSVLYCTIAMPGGNHYLARIGAFKVVFVAKLPDTPDKYIAGTFGPSGAYHFSEVGRRKVTMYTLENPDGETGVLDQNDPSLTDSSDLNGFQVDKVADWVAFRATIEGRDSEWMMGIMKGGKKTVLVDTATHEITKLDSEGLPSDRAAYGAGWNFQNRIFFASNDGEGVFEANIPAIDIAGKSISFEFVGRSVSTDFNDGLNCLTQPPPSNWQNSWITTTTTTTITGECTIYGDPHVVGFDMKPANLAAFFSSHTSDSSELGDHWLVRSSLVRIQGRYNLVDSSSGRVFLKALALGGPFLQNNTLLISHDRQAFWNDEEILTTLPSKYLNRLISANFYENALLVQDPTRRGDAPGLDVSLPSGVNLHVVEGKNGLGVRITMPPLSGGQDGLCGNFNGLGDDDTLEMVSERLAAHVAPAEVLFRHTFSAA